LKPSRGLYVPQKAILTQLKVIPEFTELGTSKYLGAGSYHALLSQLAVTDPLMKVDQQNGGHAAVRYLSVREENLLKLAAQHPKSAPSSKKNGTRNDVPRGVVAAVFPPAVAFTADQEALVEAAMAEIRRLAQPRPGAYLPRQGLLDAISAVGIAIEPPGEFLGTTSLSGFMFEVARRDPQFLISAETGGGKGYRYIPREKPKLPVPRDAAADAPTPVPTLPSSLSALASPPALGALQVDVPPFRAPELASLEAAGQAYEPLSGTSTKRWDLT
jgi:hypothetical protein